MTVSARVEGREELRRKLLSLFPAEAKKLMADANEKNANEFADRVRAIIPTGDPEDGHLASTISLQGVGEIGQSVSIGSDAHPYPLHLEAGHRNPDGTMVPGKPYWNPTKRVFRRRARGRASRALRKAVDMITR